MKAVTTIVDGERLVSQRRFKTLRLLVSNAMSVKRRLQTADYTLGISTC